MGLSGVWYWLGEEIEKLEALKLITKDKKQLEMIDKMIEDAKSKLKDIKG